MVCHPENVWGVSVCVCSSCRRPERHTKHSLFPVSPPPAVTRDRQAAWVIHCAVVHPLLVSSIYFVVASKVFYDCDVFHLEAKKTHFSYSVRLHYGRICRDKRRMSREEALFVMYFACQTWGRYFSCTNSAIYWKTPHHASSEELSALHHVVIVSSDYCSDLFIQCGLRTDDGLFLTVSE